MNLITLKPEDFTQDDEVALTGRRALHLNQVCSITLGQTLKLGLINGSIGTGEVIALAKDSVSLRVQLDQPAPEPLPVTLVLALPRPKMLKRVLQTIASMGVKQLYLINSYRVDKSYWQTPILQPENIEEQLILGLEQAGDTLLPEIHLRKRFKPFVEDELPALAKDKRALVAHPKAGAELPTSELHPSLLAIGPEGGFISYEIDLMMQQGLIPITLGTRILRVETAVPVALSRLFPPL